MRKFKIKSLIVAMGLVAFNPIASAHLETNRTVVRTDQTSEILDVNVTIPAGVTGDLYIATVAGGTLYFLVDKGNGPQFDTVTEPFKMDVSAGKIPAFKLPSSSIPKGRYPLYQVILKSGTNDPLNVNNWVGGLGGLSQIQIVAGYPDSVTGDFDRDGFADDDKNRDGYHDNDKNKDGYRDDDLNKDGYRDGDKNHDGYLDNDSNCDGTVDGNDSEVSEGSESGCSSKTTGSVSISSKHL